MQMGVKMSDLYSYLDDCDIGSSPLFSYLGHFRDMTYIEQGHNDLAMEDQIDAGNIPDLRAAGHNTPAASAPGNVGGSNPGGTGSVGSSTGSGMNQSNAGAAGANAYKSHVGGLARAGNLLGSGDQDYSGDGSDL
jgi:hypothetical protein